MSPGAIHPNTTQRRVHAITVSTASVASITTLPDVRELWQRLDLAPTLNDALRTLAVIGASVMDAAVFVFSRSAGAWTLSAQGAVAGLEVGAPADADLRTVDGPTTILTRTGERSLPQRWTCIPLGQAGRPQWLLVIHGDWIAPLGSAWADLFGDAVSRALRLAALTDEQRRSENVMTRVYSLSRRLGRAHGRGLHRAIVAATSRLLGARRVSLALYDPNQGALAIAATHGYPYDKVKDLRIRPGDEVIGHVFATGRLLVSDDRPDRQPPRPEYRSSSFIALPVSMGGAPIGTLSATEWTGDRSVGVSEIWTARLIAAAIAPALEADRLRGEHAALALAAAVDPLTGLSNRREFESRLHLEIDRSRRYRLPLAVLMIDLDGFKGLNDRHGHALGDEMLRRVAAIMHGSMRNFDLCARLGGDEFAMVLPNTTAANAALSAERLRHRIATQAAGESPAATAITVSIGVTALVDGEAPAEVLARADRALYLAKDGGRNTTRLVSG